MYGKGDTAPYAIIEDPGGNRYCFYCESSNIAVCVTQPVMSDNPQKELLLAWQNEGRKHFNRCQECGKWVSDVMYNADTMQCVDCSPWEEDPVFCSKCGTRIPPNKYNCERCSSQFLPKGGIFNDGST